MKWISITEEKYTAKDLGITSRQINYWKSKNVLPFLKPEKKAKLNIIQAVFVLIINDLSDIGLSTLKLKDLSSEILTEENFNISYFFEKSIKDCLEEKNKDIAFIYSPIDNNSRFVDDTNELFFKELLGREAFIIIPGVLLKYTEILKIKFSKKYNIKS